MNLKNKKTARMVRMPREGANGGEGPSFKAREKEEEGGNLRTKHGRC